MKMDKKTKFAYVCMIIVPIINIVISCVFLKDMPEHMIFLLVVSVVQLAGSIMTYKFKWLTIAVLVVSSIMVVIMLILYILADYYDFVYSVALAVQLLIEACSVLLLKYHKNKK